MSRKILETFVLLGAALLCAAAIASPQDLAQPVYIEADQLLIDEPKGVSVYTGHVRVRQGGISLQAEKVELYGDGKQLNRIVARGAPVVFSHQTPEVTTSAQAGHMEYLMQEARLIMTDDAQLTQGGNHFSGGRIEFDTRQDRVIASRTTDGDKPVRVIIQMENAAPGTPPAEGAAQ